MKRYLNVADGEGETPLQKAWVEFLKDQNHNIAAYLTFNDFMQQDAAMVMLRKYMAKVNGMVVGRNWDKRANKVSMR